MTALLRPALAAALVLGLAAAPAAQDVVDADVAGVTSAVSADLRAAPAVDDRDPGAVRFQARTTAPAGFVSDLDDAAAHAPAFGSFGEAAFSTERLDDGRDGRVERLAVAKAPYDGRLDDGRDGTVVAVRASLTPYDGPLDDGRPEGARRPVEVADEAPPVVIAAPVAMATTTAEGLSLSLVRPNPAVDRAELSFTLETAGSATVRVYDVRGREVAVAFEGPLAAATLQTVQIDAGALAPGTYVAVLRSAGQTASQTFQIVR